MKKHSDIFRASYSSLALLYKCAYAYYLHYIKRIKLKVVDSTGVVPGKVIHDLAEQFFIKGGKDWEIFNKYFDKIFEFYINQPYVFLGEKQFAKNKDEAKTILLQYKDNFVSELKKQNFVKPYVFSEGRLGDYDNPLIISPQIGLMGGWDLLTGETKTGQLTLVDYKASESTYYLDKRQLYFYVVGIKKMLSLDVAMVAFLLFKRKATYYYKVTDYAIKQTIIWIEEGRKLVERGNFQPTSSSRSCKLCEYRTKCKYCFSNKKSIPLKEGNVLTMPAGNL